MKNLITHIQRGQPVDAQTCYNSFEFGRLQKKIICQNNFYRIDRYSSVFFLKERHLLYSGAFYTLINFSCCADQSRYLLYFGNQSKYASTFRYLNFFIKASYYLLQRGNYDKQLFTYRIK